jgi:hypothetical protein
MPLWLTPSMLGEPLPLNLWPNLWNAIAPHAEPNGAVYTTPVRLLVGALGLGCGASGVRKAEPQEHHSPGGSHGA